jgi:hypothetical protein
MYQHALHGHFGKLAPATAGHSQRGPGGLQRPLPTAGLRGPGTQGGERHPPDHHPDPAGSSGEVDGVPDHNCGSHRGGTRAGELARAGPGPAPLELPCLEDWAGGEKVGATVKSGSPEARRLPTQKNKDKKKKS